jgi:mannose-6-phosphate isomerase
MVLTFGIAPEPELSHWSVRRPGIDQNHHIHQHKQNLPAAVRGSSKPKGRRPTHPPLARRERGTVRSFSVPARVSQRVFVHALPRIVQDGQVIEHADRPWGAYTVLAEADDFKVKTIEVQPGQRLSYQRHSRRAEHWFVVAGEGVVTLDGNTVDVRRGCAVDVPRGTAHRIHNTRNVSLVFVEVQHGDYFGEDDIVRLDDDYGRLPPGRPSDDQPD